jgi:hypothetical protein
LKKRLLITSPTPTPFLRLPHMPAGPVDFAGELLEVELKTVYVQGMNRGWT